jgi:hypothetical protein
MEKAWRMKRAGLILAGMLAVGLAIRLYIVSLDIRTLIPNFLSDDFFCYLKLSQNLAAGLGATFDGITKTNGFHPLYAIFLAFVYRLAGSSLETPIRIALATLSLFELLTGVLIYKILRLPSLGGNEKSALAGVLFWVFNPFVLTGTFYGIETAISVFFVTLALYQYLKIRNSAVALGRYAALGFLLGFAVLARTDSVFIIIAIVIDLLAQKKTHAMIVTAAISAIVASPWFVWSYLTFGIFQQNSGAVLTYIGAFKAGSFLSRSYIAAKMQAFYLAVRIIALFLASVALPATFFLLLHMRKKIKLRIDFRKLLLNVIVLFGIILFFYYPVLMWGATRRYYQPLLVVTAIAVGLMFKPLTLSKDRRIPTVFILLLIVNLAAVTWFYFAYRNDAPQAWQLDLYETAFWLQSNTQPSDRIGSFNFAIMGYFSNRTVIDTIGVMNDEAYHAVLNHRLFSYIEERDIRYLVDNEDTFDSMAPFMGDINYMQHLKPIYKKPLNNRPNEFMVVYEVVNESR